MEDLVVSPLLLRVFVGWSLKKLQRARAEPNTRCCMVSKCPEFTDLFLVLPVPEYSRDVTTWWNRISLSVPTMAAALRREDAYVANLKKENVSVFWDLFLG